MTLSGCSLFDQVSKAFKKMKQYKLANIKMRPHIFANIVRN